MEERGGERRPVDSPGAQHGGSDGEGWAGEGGGKAHGCQGCLLCRDPGDGGGLRGLCLLGWEERGQGQTLPADAGGVGTAARRGLDHRESSHLMPGRKEGGRGGHAHRSAWVDLAERKPRSFHPTPASSYLAG